MHDNKIITTIEKHKDVILKHNKNIYEFVSFIVVKVQCNPYEWVILLIECKCIINNRKV